MIRLSYRDFYGVHIRSVIGRLRKIHGKGGKFRWPPSGTSSILAGACVKALFQAFGESVADNDVFDRVLCME